MAEKALTDQQFHERVLVSCLRAAINNASDSRAMSKDEVAATIEHTLRDMGFQARVMKG